MKRIFSACLAAALVFASAAVPAGAEDRIPYTVESVGMELHLPADWFVLTGHTEEDDPALGWLGMTAGEVNDFLASRNIHLNAIAPDFSQELTVTVGESESTRNIWNLSDADEELVQAIRDAYLGTGTEDAKRNLEQYAPELSEQIDVSNFQITKSGQRETIQARFLMFQGNVSTSEVTSEIYQAITVINGQMITLVLRPQGGLTEEGIRLLNGIVDTAVFENVKNKPGSGALPFANPYVIVVAGILLILVGWLIDRHRRKRNQGSSFTAPAWSVGGSLSQNPVPPPPAAPPEGKGAETVDEGAKKE